MAHNPYFNELDTATIHTHRQVVERFTDNLRNWVIEVGEHLVQRIEQFDEDDVMLVRDHLGYINALIMAADPNASINVEPFRNLIDVTMNDIDHSVINLGNDFLLLPIDKTVDRFFEIIRVSIKNLNEDNNSDHVTIIEEG